MKTKYFKPTLLLLIFTLLFSSYAMSSVVVNATAVAPNLGAASSFGILGATTTVTSQTYVNGDIGSGGQTGTATIVPQTGANYIASSEYTNAQLALGNAITAANTQLADFTVTTATYDLGGKTLTPGVYNFTGPGAVSINSDTTLTGDGVYIFNILGAFNTAAATHVKLTNGANVCNVFWVANVATLGANSTLTGTLMSKSAITLGADSLVNGRILAQTAVTANAANTIINVPGCPVAPVTTPTPTATPTPTPTATPIGTNSSRDTSSSGSSTTSTPAPTSTPVPTTSTPAPTSIPVPSSTPAPTSIPVPSSIPVPTTSTSELLSTPVPTSTPVPSSIPVPTITAVPVVVPQYACDSAISVTLVPNGNLIIHAKLPNDVKGTGTWNFNLGGTIYKVNGNEEITYTSTKAPVGTYKISAQFVFNDGRQPTDLKTCIVSVPTVTGGKLPNTATPWYNILVIGMILMVIGTLFWRKKKLHE